jgi:hypothetical protein
MNPRRRVLNIVTDGAGAATVVDTLQVSGRVITVQYIPDGTVPMSNGATLTITGQSDDGGIESILAAAAVTTGTVAQTWAPRQPVHTQAGAAVGATIVDKVVMADETLKLVVAAGGAAKKGVVVVILE